MKIEAGYWKTRDGRKARVLCTDAPGGTPVKGYLVLDNGESVSLGWRENGLIDVPEFSLIEPWREPTKYSVDMWFKEHPKPGAVNDGVSGMIFGQPISALRWNPDQYGACDKHYRITVEEVTE